MKKIVLTPLLLLTCWFVHAQTFDVEAILYNGDNDKHINFVILSDGYRANELSKFVTDAQNFTNALFDAPPYKQYKNYFNVYIIKVPSNESGASHPGTATDVTEPAHPVKKVDNYFGSSFDAFGIHRLLVPENNIKIFNVLAKNFPAYDQVVILVNSPYYGGSGGSFATASLHPSTSEIAIHELGHSFAGLNDEYWAGSVYASEAINMTQETDPTLVRWKNWYHDKGIGIYQHCCGEDASNWYKPHQSCKMQFLGVPHCAVCTEGIIETIHDLTNPIADYTPSSTNISANSTSSFEFQLNLVNPVPNTLKINWKLNNVKVGTNTNSLQITSGDLKAGTNDLTVTVQDNTEFLRVDNHAKIHVYSVSWTIQYNKNPGTFPDPNKWYVIQNKSNGLNMRNENCISAPQTYVELRNGMGSCAQWRFIEKGDAWIIQNRESGLNMRNDDCNNSKKTLIELWDGTGSCAQWKIIPSPEIGYYHLNNVKSGLNIRNQDCADGPTRVELFNGTGSCARWQFIAVGDIDSNTRKEGSTIDQDKKGVIVKSVEAEEAHSQKSGSINLYPNPSQRSLHIDYGSPGLEEITLTDLNGHILLQQEETLVQQTILNVQGLPAGLYLLKLSGTQGTVVRRVILAEE